MISDLDKRAGLLTGRSEAVLSRNLMLWFNALFKKKNMSTNEHQQSQRSENTVILMPGNICQRNTNRNQARTKPTRDKQYSDFSTGMQKNFVPKLNIHNAKEVNCSLTFVMELLHILYVTNSFSFLSLVFQPMMKKTTAVAKQMTDLK